MVSTAKWGPPGWKFLHAISVGYPEHPTRAERLAYRQFFHSLGPVLPCPLCRASYAEFIRTFPPDRYLANREQLMIWVYEFHNMVNQKLIAQGHRIRIPTYSAVSRHYLSWRT
jgi:hypothetical protein